MFNACKNCNLVKVLFSFYKTANSASTKHYFVQTLYMSVAVYLTSLALEVVAPISFHWGVIITCFVCTFYTVLVSLGCQTFYLFELLFSCLSSLIVCFFNFFIFKILKTGRNEGGNLGGLLSSVHHGFRMLFRIYNDVSQCRGHQ